LDIINVVGYCKYMLLTYCVGLGDVGVIFKALDPRFKDLTLMNLLNVS